MKDSIDRGRGDYQTAIDLENCYFHIRVNESHQKYLGFKFKDPNTSQEVFFVSKVMIYGVKVATAIVTRLTKALVMRLHSLGIKYSMYIDDGRVLSSSYKIAVQNHETVLDMFQNAGWNIQF